MKNARAYTLIELLIVIGIIGLLAAFGIPAFSRYGHQSESGQKAEEVKALFGQVYSLAQNPESTMIKKYQMDFNNDTSGEHSYSLISCRDDDCSDSSVYKKVDLLSEQSIQMSGNSSGWLFYCTTKLTDGKPECDRNTIILTSNQIALFSDNNGNVLKNYNLNVDFDPFKITLSSEEIN